MSDGLWADLSLIGVHEHFLNYNLLSPNRALDATAWIARLTESDPIQW